MHLVVFIIRICHDARSHELQICGTLLSNLKHYSNTVSPHSIFSRRRHLPKAVLWKFEKYCKAVSSHMMNLLLNNSVWIRPPPPLFHFLSKSWWNWHSTDICDISYTCGFGDGIRHFDIELINGVWRFWYRFRISDWRLHTANKQHILGILIHSLMLGLKFKNTIKQEYDLFRKLHVPKLSTCFGHNGP